MNKRVFLVGFDPHYRSGELDDAIEKVLKAQDIPVVQVKVRRTLSRGQQFKLLLANTEMLKTCDKVLLNQWASEEDCKLIGTAVLREIPVKVFREGLRPEESRAPGILGATMVIEESTITKA